MELAKIKCIECGSEFKQGRVWQKYCSGVCRQIAFWKRQQKRGIK